MLGGAATHAPRRAALRPLYLKYNAVLRAATKVEREEKRFDELCQGNQYTTTLHAINSCVLKLARLTEATKVYRGIAGGVLPEKFFLSDEYNVRGGIELGFMSTTLEREVALSYAGGLTPTVIEMQQGMMFRLRLEIADPARQSPPAITHACAGTGAQI